MHRHKNILRHTCQIVRKKKKTEITKFSRRAKITKLLKLLSFLYEICSHAFYTASYLSESHYELITFPSSTSYCRGTLKPQRTALHSASSNLLSNYCSSKWHETIHFVTIIIFQMKIYSCNENPHLQH